VSDDNNWGLCVHDWKERDETNFSNDFFIEVRCEKCECLGEQDVSDGTVFWPAT
jgi:hypothetical protein